jgi:dTDP-4-amino-4,6-dideoxy-D-galactose acyltransferase
MIKPLEWDSNFFGIKTGKIDASGLSKELVAEELGAINTSGFQLVYIFAGHESIDLKKEILRSGGKLVDEKVTYFMNIHEVIPLNSEFIRSCFGQETDIELDSLAIESGKYSRFRTDGQIPRKKFEELYRLWMKNSLNGSFAREVFVYVADGKKLGMVSVNIRENEGWIGIIAVNEDSRGKSVGKLLMHAAIHFCQKQNIKVLNVQTQMENKVSCAFYEKIGFKVKVVEDVFHFWSGAHLRLRLR